MSREQLFLSELALIERVIVWVCARRRLRQADAEDFGSTVKLRLIENDYAILAKFEGRSSLKTYLVAVINRLYLDYQVQRFGKWRPSAEARRLGPLALRLESLLHRDGLTFEEAAAVLQTELRPGESREVLDELSLKLPRRANGRPRPGSAHEPAERSSETTAVEQAERQALADRTFHVIRCSLGRLPPSDQIFLRMHVEEGMSVADVARGRGEDQKALYRRKEGALKQLRAELEAEGIRSPDAQDLLSTLDWQAALTPESGSSGPPPETDESRPSTVNGHKPPAGR